MICAGTAEIEPRYGDVLRCSDVEIAMEGNHRHSLLEIVRILRVLVQQAIIHGRGQSNCLNSL